MPSWVLDARVEPKCQAIGWHLFATVGGMKLRGWWKQVSVVEGYLKPWNSHFLHFLPLKNRPLTCQKETRKYSFWHPFSGAKMWASGRVDVFRKSENLKESYKTFVVSDHLSLACALVCTEGSGTSPVSQNKGYEVVRYENKLDAGN